MHMCVEHGQSWVLFLGVEVPLPCCGLALDVQPQVQNLCLLALTVAGSSRGLSEPVFQDPSCVCAPFWKERLCRQRLWIRSGAETRFQSLTPALAPALV